LCSRLLDSVSQDRRLGRVKTKTPRQKSGASQNGCAARFVEETRPKTASSRDQAGA
jgi:hypothetical protein